MGRDQAVRPLAAHTPPLWDMSLLAGMENETPVHTRTDRRGLQGSSLPPSPPGLQGLSDNNHSKLLDKAKALASDVDAAATTGEETAVLEWA